MPDIERLLREIGDGGVFRTSDLEALGMSRARPNAWSNVARLNN